MTYKIYTENTDGKIMSIDDLAEAQKKLAEFPRKHAQLRAYVVSELLDDATHISEYYDAGLVEIEGASL